jgi:hypothetical protein
MYGEVHDRGDDLVDADSANGERIAQWRGRLETLGLSLAIAVVVATVGTGISGVTASYTKTGWDTISALGYTTDGSVIALAFVSFLMVTLLRIVFTWPPATPAARGQAALCAVIAVSGWGVVAAVLRALYVTAGNSEYQGAPTWNQGEQTGTIISNTATGLVCLGLLVLSVMAFRLFAAPRQAPVPVFAQPAMSETLPPAMAASAQPSDGFQQTPFRN